MKIQPKREEELNSFDLLPDGTYPFTVLESGEIPSKSVKNKGRMMFAVKLNVHGPNGDRHVYDYFADWFSEWKLRHFAATTGQLKEYEAGELNGDASAFAGRVGFVTLSQEPGGQYKAKNVVDDYVVKEQPKEANASAPPDGDDVPF